MVSSTVDTVWCFFAVLIVVFLAAAYARYFACAVFRYVSKTLTPIAPDCLDELLGYTIYFLAVELEALCDELVCVGA